MVLYRYQPPDEGGEACYYDDQGDECIWVLPPLVEGDSLPQANLEENSVFTRKIEKAYSKVCD